MTGPQYGAPAPNGQQPGYGPPAQPAPGQAAFNVPMPGGPVATIIQERGWSGFPAAAIPPMPPDPRLNPNNGAPAPQWPAQAGAPAQPQWPGQPAAPAQYQPGMGVPTQHPQPQTQPGVSFQPQGQPAPGQQPGGIDPNTVLSGPGIPTELQGLTLQQAIGMYGNMRNLAIALQQRSNVTAQQPPQAPPAQGQAPTQGQQPAQFDWRNPAASFEQIVERALERRLAPMEQDSIVNRATQARNVVAQEVGPQRFAQIEASVIQYLQGADPRALGDPELWRVAVRTAIGDATLRGGQQPPQGAPTPDPRFGGAVPFRPGMQNPAPQLNTFFTETPQAGGQAVQGVTLTPQQMWFADQMGVSYADYAAYSQGVPPVNPAQGGRR